MLYSKYTNINVIFLPQHGDCSQELVAYAWMNVSGSKYKEPELKVKVGLERSHLSKNIQERINIHSLEKLGKVLKGSVSFETCSTYFHVNNHHIFPDLYTPSHYRPIYYRTMKNNDPNHTLLVLFYSTQRAITAKK